MKPIDILVLSVNIGTAKPIAAKTGMSGIFKAPHSGPISVSKSGMAGDAIVDVQHHGGLDQAVYVYCQSDYDWWQSHHGITPCPGLFGENLTIQGMQTSDAHVGARLLTGGLVLEITAHRTPCQTLAARLNDSTFPKRFWRSRRTGFYCRVIQGGTVQAGARMQFQPFEGEIIFIAELISHDPFDKIDPATRKRLLSAPLHNEMKEQLLRNAETVTEAR